MMKAVCQLCQDVIESKFVAPPTEDAEGRNRVEQIEYDRLSAYMWLHISENHPDQTQEGILCQQRAAKLYAMNWADVDPNLDGVRVHWRSQMLVKMSTTTAYTDQAAAPPAATPPAAGGPSSSTGSSE